MQQQGGKSLEICLFRAMPAAVPIGGGRERGCLAVDRPWGAQGVRGMGKGASAAVPCRAVPTRNNAARGHGSRKALAFAHSTEKSTVSSGVTAFDSRGLTRDG